MTQGGATVDILELLEQLEQELNAGRRMPIGGGVVVDRKRVSDLIAELRLAIPANVRQARSILERGDQALEEARERAAQIVAGAQREADHQVAESEILRRAREEARQVERAARDTAERTLHDAEQRAARLLADAEHEAQTQRDEAEQYAVALLAQLQRMLGSFLGNVRESLAQFPPREAADEP